jgi:hypothetical protein
LRNPGFLDYASLHPGYRLASLSALRRGPVGAMTMYGQAEYIGRALNVECRLQSSIQGQGQVADLQGAGIKRRIQPIFLSSQRR